MIYTRSFHHMMEQAIRLEADSVSVTVPRPRFPDEGARSPKSPAAWATSRLYRPYFSNVSTRQGLTARRIDSAAVCSLG